MQYVASYVIITYVQYESAGGEISSRKNFVSQICLKCSVRKSQSYNLA